MTEDATPMSVPERERLFEVVADWVHAVWFIVALPVLLGSVLAGTAGWWLGFAAFVTLAGAGARTVYQRHAEPADG